MAEQFERNTLAAPEDVDGDAPLPFVPAALRSQARSARSSRARAAGDALCFLRRSAAAHTRRRSGNTASDRGHPRGSQPRIAAAVAGAPIGNFFGEIPPTLKADPAVGTHRNAAW